MDIFTQAEQAAAFIISKTTMQPSIAIVLGSGLGDFADSLTQAVRIPYADIPHFCRSTAIGHAGQLVIGKAGDNVVIAMQGRFHPYEGYPADKVVFTIRVLYPKGVRAAQRTN